MVRRLLIALTAAVFCSGVAGAFAEDKQPGSELPKPIAYEVVPQRSWLRFEVTQSDSILRAELKNFQTNILFHPQNPKESHVRVVIRLGDIQSAAQDLVTNVVKPEWFDVPHFPEAVFESKEIIQVSPNHFLAKGDLILRGISKPVEVNFMYSQLDLNSALVEGAATVKRLDYGVGQGDWKKTNIIKDDVVVRFRLEALQTEKM